MKQYVLTEAEKKALLTELELERLQAHVKNTAPGLVNMSPEEQVKHITDIVHRRFHYHVCKALE